MTQNSQSVSDTKARFVADGHEVSTPPSMSCGTVVSRHSVRISSLVAASNDLDVLGCNVQNSFLLADDLEKHCLIAGDEFGHEKGEVFIVVRAPCDQMCSSGGVIL